MSRKKSKGHKKKLPQRMLQQVIVKMLRRKPDKSYPAKLIGQRVAPHNSKDAILAALHQLKQREKVIQKGNKYAIHPNDKGASNRGNTQLKGRVDMTASGSGFVVCEGQERDIFVSERNLNGALHNDLVIVTLHNSKNSRRPSGEVVKVIERNTSSFMGDFKRYKNQAVVYVDDRRYNLEIKVYPRDYNQAKDGDRVVVEVYQWGNAKNNTILGRIVTAVDTSDRNEVEMTSILINNGFNIAFPTEVLEETRALDDTISMKGQSQRRDLRDMGIFTIDPADAKDFDDALSYEELEDGAISVGIHIADVTHFVKPNTALDKEALDRATSVYLVDRVCPMLPERISNDLCSLVPHQDRYCFSAIFTFNKNKKITEQWFGKTIIHSKRRFTYQEAQDIIDAGTGEYHTALSGLNELAKHLKKKRFKEGSIDFDSEEIRFELNDKKEPVKIITKERKDTHKLVEEFMLLANKRVAHFISRKEKPAIPFVYRIHDLPDPERLVELGALAKELGVKLKFDSPDHIADALNKLSTEVTDKGLQSILKSMAIRSMAKAVYSTDNIGHYGLGFEDYTHFTSPIRRYSDVLVHRILYDTIEHNKRYDKEKLTAQCLHISNRERMAVNAERDSKRYKQIEFITPMLGAIKTGMVRGIIDRGVFVELEESKVDGFIPFESLSESFEIVPSRIKAVGQDTKLTLCLGDIIEVKIVDVDIDKKQATFEWVRPEDK